MHKGERKQEFTHRLADRAVQDNKLAAQQKSRPFVTCEGEKLKNVFKFKYLGTLFAANGEERFDIDARIAKAKVRCGKLRSIFDSPILSLRIKLRLYVASVCSLLTYGAET